MSFGTTHLGRDELADACFLAFAARKHVLIYGPPGTGKTNFARQIFGQIEGGRTFDVSLTKCDEDFMLFGGLDIEEWRKGNIQFNVENSLADCDFALLNEMFDGNEAVLRSMLDILNEREFNRGSHIIKNCPLRSAIATSNFMRQNENMTAVIDRFLVRAKVDFLSDSKDRMEMYKRYSARTPGPIGTITMAELDTIAEQVHSPNGVTIEDRVFGLFDKIVNETASETKQIISDRRKNEVLDLLKAKCLIEGQTVARDEDLLAVKYALVTLGDENHDGIFEAVFEKVVISDAQHREKETELMAHEKKISDLAEIIRTESDISQVVPLIPALKKLRKEIALIRESDYPDKARADEAINFATTALDIAKKRVVGDDEDFVAPADAEKEAKAEEVKEAEDPGVECPDCGYHIDTTPKKGQECPECCWEF